MKSDDQYPELNKYINRLFETKPINQNMSTFNVPKLLDHKGNEININMPRQQGANDVAKNIKHWLELYKNQKVSQNYEPWHINGSVGGRYSTYRPVDQQLDMFQQRYEPQPEIGAVDLLLRGVIGDEVDGEDGWHYEVIEADDGSGELIVTCTLGDIVYQYGEDDR